MYFRVLTRSVVRLVNHSQLVPVKTPPTFEQYIDVGIRTISPSSAGIVPGTEYCFFIVPRLSRMIVSSAPELFVHVWASPSMRNYSLGYVVPLVILATCQCLSSPLDTRYVFLFRSYRLCVLGNTYILTVGWVKQPLKLGVADLKKDYEPGNFGFDPLGLMPKDEAGRKTMMTKEINNGRLAMLATIGVWAQELVDGKTILGHLFS